MPIKYLEGTRDDLPGASHSAARQIKELPPHPTLVFINPKSGGQMGTALLKLFGEVVGVVQVSNGQRPMCGRTPVMNAGLMVVLLLCLRIWVQTGL